MKELSELEKTLLMGLYNQRIDDDGKYLSVKENGDVFIDSNRNDWEIINCDCE